MYKQTDTVGGKIFRIAAQQKQNHFWAVNQLLRQV
jgi:hypothetical protein